MYLFGWDGNPVEDGSELTLYKYPSFECVGKTRTVSHEVTYTSGSKLMRQVALLLRLVAGFTAQDRLYKPCS